MSSETDVLTAEDIIGAALYSLADRREYGLPDAEHFERELPDMLDRYRSDPVTADELASRRGGLATAGLVTTLLASPLVTAVVAQIVADQIQAGARAATGRLARWRTRRRRQRLAAALRQPAQRWRADDEEWLRGFLRSEFETAGCAAEQAATLTDALCTAWLELSLSRREPPGPAVPGPVASDPPEPAGEPAAGPGDDDRPPGRTTGEDNAR
ncbi:hypothetical protein ABZT48_23645 [Streptomyces avermitilis]|uniref:hypothetical protein n=1 Tax=Streptomyces avermitilis TaxID=33903 RepID=UPI0033A47C60